MRLVVLASASPRRRELLSRFCPDCRVRGSDVDENTLASRTTPVEGVEAAAVAKALDVARREPEALVLAFDTAVVVGDAVLGKPADEDEAVAMILRLGGREHEVVTGLCVIDTTCSGWDPSQAVEHMVRRSPQTELPGGSDEVVAPGVAVGHERTAVKFAPLNESRARRYVAQGESLDKAGAYGIQGKAGILVESIRGCYYNVVGLPLYRFSQMLARFGADLLIGLHQEHR